MFLINLLDASVLCAYGRNTTHNTHQIGYHRVDKDSKDKSDIFDHSFEYHSSPFNTESIQKKQHEYNQILSQSGHQMDPQRPVGFETQQFGFQSVGNTINGVNVNTPMQQGVELQNGMDPRRNIHAGKRTKPLLNGQEVRENTNSMRIPFGQSSTLFGYQGDSDDYDD